MGYVWVPIELAELGAARRGRLPDRSLVATVRALPFLDPNKDVPKS